MLLRKPLPAQLKQKRFVDDHAAESRSTFSHASSLSHRPPPPPLLPRPLLPKPLLPKPLLLRFCLAWLHLLRCLKIHSTQHPKLPISNPASHRYSLLTLQCNSSSCSNTSTLPLQGPPNASSPRAATPQFSAQRGQSPRDPRLSLRNTLSSSPPTPVLVRTNSPTASQVFGTDPQGPSRQSQSPQTILTGDPRAASLERLSAISVRESNGFGHPSQVPHIPVPMGPPPRRGTSGEPINRLPNAFGARSRSLSQSGQHSFHDESAVGGGTRGHSTLLDASQLAASMSINYDTDSEV